MLILTVTTGVNKASEKEKQLSCGPFTLQMRTGGMLFVKHSCEFCSDKRVSWILVKGRHKAWLSLSTYWSTSLQYR